MPPQLTGLVPPLGIYPLTSPDWSPLQVAARAACSWRPPASSGGGAGVGAFALPGSDPRRG
eukprot:3477557-Pyramimonas_sp.AAC.1